MAIKHITENREALDKITEALLEKETLSGGEQALHPHRCIGSINHRMCSVCMDACACV